MNVRGRRGREPGARRVQRGAAWRPIRPDEAPPRMGDPRDAEAQQRIRPRLVAVLHEQRRERGEERREQPDRAAEVPSREGEQREAQGDTGDRRRRPQRHFPTARDERPKPQQHEVPRRMHVVAQLGPELGREQPVLDVVRGRELVAPQRLSVEPREAQPCGPRRDQRERGELAPARAVRLRPGFHGQHRVEAENAGSDGGAARAGTLDDGAAGSLTKANGLRQSPPQRPYCRVLAVRGARRGGALRAAALRGPFAGDLRAVPAGEREAGARSRVSDLQTDGRVRRALSRRAGADASG